VGDLSVDRRHRNVDEAMTKRKLIEN